MDYTVSLSLPMHFFLIFMVGFAGFVDAAAGGGGLISLPAYFYAGFPAHLAYGTNKFTATSGTLFSTIRFFKNGVMELKIALIAAAGSFIGSALASQLVLIISEPMLKKMMLVILPIIAVIILTRRHLPDVNRCTLGLTRKKIALASIIGFVIGMYDGLFGPGTGTFALMAFNMLMGYDLRSSNGNAKVLNLSSNIAGLITYLSAGLVFMQVAIPCAIANILGNFLGSRLVLKNGAKFIRPMMTFVILLLLGKIIFSL